MSERALPQPLPPEERTVGQLVAESIRFYGHRFWAVLPLGLPVALLDELSIGHRYAAATLLMWAVSPLVALAFVRASALVAGVELTPRAVLTALAVGVVVWLPAPALSWLFVLPALAWLAAFGLAVPAAAIERLDLRDAIGRGLRLARADYVHVLGGLCTLAIVYFVTRTMLFVLLRGQGDAAERVASFAADVVISPLLFVGAALLYFDQAARLESGTRRPRRSRDADLHHALDAEHPGHPDPEVEP